MISKVYTKFTIVLVHFVEFLGDLCGEIILIYWYNIPYFLANQIKNAVVVVTVV